MAATEDKVCSNFDEIEFGTVYEVHQWQKDRWIEGVFKAKGGRAGLFSSEQELAYLVTPYTYDANEFPAHVKLAGETVLKLVGEPDEVKWYKQENKKDTYEINVNNEWKQGKFMQLGKRIKFRTAEGKNMWLTEKDGNRIRKFGSSQTLMPSTKADLSLPGFDVIDTPMDWNSCHAMHVSEEGSAGVLFCQMGEKITVVKNGQMSVSELFAYHIAKKIDIRLPSCRIISAGDSQEWWDAKFVLSTWAHRNRAEKVSVSSFVHGLSREFLVMEFIPGCPFLEFAEAFSHDQFVSLGKILVFDLFMNNRDRLPTGMYQADDLTEEARFEQMRKFGVHLGNKDNIMVSSDGSIIGIDNETGLMPLGDELKTYCERCVSILEDALDFAHGKDRIRRSLTEFFRFYEKEFSDDNWRSIQEGIRICCKTLSQLTKEDINSTSEMVAGMVKENSMVWAELISNLNMDSMLFTLENVFQKLLAS